MRARLYPEIDFKPESTMNEKTKTHLSLAGGETQLAFASLRDRLEAGRESAEAAWAAKASGGFRDTVVTLSAMIREYDVRAPEVRCEEDLLRLRAELAELLRSAAAAIAPKSV